MSIEMIKLCIDYLRLILFCSGLLIGIQVPAVVDQYEKRIDAHLTEALQILAGFQQTADRYFNGSVHELVAHYESSNDPVFKDDARNIRFISERVSALQSEAQTLQQSAVWRVLHVVTMPDKQIIQQTMQQYSYMILIDPQALIWGVICGFLIATVLEGILHLLGFCLLCFTPHKHGKNT
jgi:hypothetical protein